jgi:hypothetical protein
MASAQRPGYSPAVRRKIVFPRTALLASTMALVSSFGCKQEEPTVEAADYPGRMATGYCNAVFSCQCEDYPYDNPNECFADLLSSYDTANDAAFLAGLAYDGTCPAQELEYIESLACRGAIPSGPDICVPPCNVWHGGQQAGFACQVLASSPELGLGWSNCAQGLNCVAGLCVNPCQGGGQILPQIGQPCPQGICAAGAMCDETMTCVAATPLPTAGQPCLDGACNPDVAVCVQAANTCAALPTTGQPCVEGQCDANSMCNIDSLCVARPALACFLLGGGVPGDGDGDGDTTGDGDGDTTGDGDGDTTGDGDGDGDTGDPNCVPTPIGDGYAGNTVDSPAVYTGGCGGSGPEAVLSYIAPGSGTFQISTEGSDYDTILYVRDGGDCMGAELACDDDGVAPASLLEVSLSAGQEITIFVDSYSGGGNYVLSITLI